MKGFRIVAEGRSELRSKKAPETHFRPRGGRRILMGSRVCVWPCRAVVVAAGQAGAAAADPRLYREARRRGGEARTGTKRLGLVLLCFIIQQFPTFLYWSVSSYNQNAVNQISYTLPLKIRPKNKYIKRLECRAHYSNQQQGG